MFVSQALYMLFWFQVALFAIEGNLTPVIPKVDYRDSAAHWLSHHLSASQTVGFGSTPWFWTVPLDPFFSHPQPNKWFRFATPEELSHYVFDPGKPFDTDQLKAARPAYVVLANTNMKTDFD
jgi:hypothetical protein